MANAIDLIDAAIADLEAKLNLPPGGTVPDLKKSEDRKSKEEDPSTTLKEGNQVAKKEGKNDEKKQVGKNKDKQKKPKKEKGKQNASKKGNVANLDQPDICKLEFKVGKIVKVWVHPDADKLYCEEIDCGEEKPREIASGLRLHYTEEQMLGRRVLVVSNLKTKKLAGFPSSGMVLCAAEKKDDDSELVEFIEPPAETPVGEIVKFDGLPDPEPFSGAQVEKKKVFQACMDGMKTTEDCLAAWNGHIFTTSGGPCRSTSIKGGAMR